MPYCKKLLKALLHCMLLAWLFAASAQAEEISVKMVEFRLGEEGYQLAANYDIGLSFAVKQALSRGTPIYFVSEFSLTHARWGWFETAQQSLLRTLPRYFVGDSPRARLSWLDEEVYKGEQTLKLSYSVLTGRYRISRGALFQNFASLEEALSMLSRQSSAVIPAELLKKDGDYMAAARLRLDIAQLPKPLQVNALTDSDWSLDSDWYRWVIGPTEASMHSGQKTE
ncbi:MAG: DUF4390 domain-containing protein [Nitrosomonadales bacterium]|nr:DUF4390 domain-containing protein [Nitrosomonadales bacterium]